MIAEESQEALAALASGDRHNLAQELADLAYVAYGTALVYGLDLDQALAEVHRANMSKLDQAGQPIVHSSGKVLKGANYSPPALNHTI